MGAGWICTSQDTRPNLPGVKSSVRTLESVLLRPWPVASHFRRISYREIRARPVWPFKGCHQLAACSHWPAPVAGQTCWFSPVSSPERKHCKVTARNLARHSLTQCLVEPLRPRIPHRSLDGIIGYRADKSRMMTVRLLMLTIKTCLKHETQNCRVE